MTKTSSSPTRSTSWHLALIGGLARRGPWEMRDRTIAISAIGGADLDLTEATIPPHGAIVVKISLIGGLKLRVPAGVKVVVHGFSLIGGRALDTGPADSAAPTVHVHAYGVFGGIKLDH